MVTQVLHLPLDTQPLWFIISGLTVFNLFTGIRMKMRYHVSELEFFLQLSIDITALFGLLYYSGGPSNPFTSLFVLQVIIAAITLSPLLTWLAAALAVGFYIVLMFEHVDVPFSHHHELGQFFNMHLYGMLFSFMLLAILIPWFAAKMATTIRRQDQLLLDAEHIAALGTLATSAAHELGSPLATMAIIAGECLEEASTDEQRQRAEVLGDQIKRCKSIISHIAASAGSARAISGRQMPLQLFLKEIIDQFTQQRQTIVHTSYNGRVPSPVIVTEYSLQQAILNLLHNAADATTDLVLIECTWTNQQLSLSIRDHGRGIPEAIIKTLGHPITSTKPHGLGMGLYLVQTVMNRFDGHFTLFNHPEGGAVASITLPLKRLSV